MTKKHPKKLQISVDEKKDMKAGDGRKKSAFKQL